MKSFLKWVIGIALALAASGELNPATLKMASLAVEAQRHQISYSKFSRALTSGDKDKP